MNRQLRTLNEIALKEGITELSYKEFKLELVDNYGDLYWKTEWDDLAKAEYNKMFRTWLKNLQQRKGYRGVHGPGDYDYDRLQTDIMYNHTHDQEFMERHYTLFKFRNDIQRLYNALVGKPVTPLNDGWFINQLTAKLPWTSPKFLAQLIVASLNDRFLPTAAITGLFKSYVTETDTYHIGHYAGYPIIWRYKYDWSTHDTITELDTITVEPDTCGLVVRLNKYNHWLIKDTDSLENCLSALPNKIIKLWLDHTGPVMAVCTLWERGVRQDENYDSQIYYLKSCAPGTFNMKNKLETAEQDYMTVYNQVDIKKGE